MRQLYSKYFQKSFSFLYPLLGIPRHAELQPKQVFLAWDGRFGPKDRKIACYFRRTKTDQVWADFELNHLLSHSMLDYCEEISDQEIIYVFDLNNHAEDFELFLQGKYSKLSAFAKERIAHYFGISTPEFVYMESFLYPEKYHKVYAELLNVKIQRVQEVHELCNPYDPEKETIKLSPQQVTS